MILCFGPLRIFKRLDLTGPRKHEHLIRPFSESPSELTKREWGVAISGCWYWQEDILRTEGRAAVLGARHLLHRGPWTPRRFLVLSDNLPLVLAAGKGRASSLHLLPICRQLDALALFCKFMFILRWIPSEINSADEPSRAIFSRDRKLHIPDAPESRWDVSPRDARAPRARDASHDVEAALCGAIDLAATEALVRTWRPDGGEEAAAEAPGDRWAPYRGSPPAAPRAPRRGRGRGAGRGTGRKAAPG